MEFKSKTLAQKVSFEGVGIHTGEITKVTVHPAERKGIFFYRRGSSFPALHSYVVNTVAATDLGNGEFTVRTVEHILAALYLLGIDSAVIEVERGNEVPILDGGAKTFFDAFVEAGLVETGFPVTYLVVKNYQRFQPNGNFVEVFPYEGELFVYEGIFPFVGRKRVSFEGKVNEALIGARTFCLAEDVPSLWVNSLGLGGYPVNTLPLTEDLKYLVYSEEPAYHKLLDLIGDLTLLGGRLVGKVYSFKGNHTLNHQLRELLLKGNLKRLEGGELTFSREPLRVSV